MTVTYDVKTNERKSDVIFSSLNRFYDAKLSGGLKDDELSKLIVLVGDLFANQIKQEKQTENSIESFEAHLDGLDGPNAGVYFSHVHKNLDRAVKSVLEGNDIAKQELEQRREYAQPVMSAESYTKTFRKLG